MTWILSKEETKFYKKVLRRLDQGKPFVLWGWKRDKVINGVRYPDSRTVYFSADFSLVKQRLKIKRGYFFLESRVLTREIGKIIKVIGQSRKLSDKVMRVRVWRDVKFSEYSRLRMEIGEGKGYDKRTVKRRLRGKPRLVIEPEKIIEEDADFDIEKFAPMALYCGSGLSSESRLPLLGSIHEMFAVDDVKNEKLIFGADDPLPRRLVTDVDWEFKNFCRFNVNAIKARPARSHLLIRRLYKKGVIREIYTDNVDDILLKVGVPYIQTRVSIFPDRFKVNYDRRIKALLVVGISVDRRGIIKQARRRGLKIIVVNPVLGVAPYSRNMDYLYKGDIFYRGRAREILPKIVKASGF